MSRFTLSLASRDAFIREVVSFGRGDERTVSVAAAQLSMLLEGIDWRRPERRWDMARFH
jgi:hypothetical protein